MSDRTPNDLADFIARKGKNRRSDALAYPAGSEMRAWIMAEAEQYHAAARLLREQAEQLDTLRNAIGDPRYVADRYTPRQVDRYLRELALADALAAAGGGVPEEGATDGTD